MFYNITNRSGQQPTITVFGDFGEKVITTTHPYYGKVRDYLLNNEDHDESELARILDPLLDFGPKLAAVDPRITFDIGSVKLDGLPVDSRINQQLLARFEDGDDESWDRLVRFLIKLDQNPSKAAQDALYSWIEQHGIALTEDGDFVAHKGVRDDGTSQMDGPNNFINGVLYKQPGVSYHVPNEVGSVISKKRGDVDDNTSLACSTGLHVGTLEYATGFAPRLLTVKVNPADVVSVPDHDLTWKIRVCRYEVIAINENKSEFSGRTYDTTPEELADGIDLDEADEGLDLLPEDEGDFAMIPEAQDDTTPEDIGDWPTLAVGLVKPSGVTGDPTLTDWADANQIVKDDLKNSRLGHKELGRKWASITTESSIRRWRKSNGVKLTTLTKLKG